MKKLRLSLLIVFVGMVSLVVAQSASLNIKGGLNMSNFYGDNLSDKNMKPGFHIGVGADLEFVTNISLQTGLYFSSKGAKYTYDLPVVGDVEYNVTANYVQLPLHLAYKIDVTPDTKLFFHAGPYIAYGIGGKRSIDSKYSADLDKFFGEQEVDTFDKKYGYKRLDTGVGIGVGAEFNLIFIDLGWDMGLTNIGRKIEDLPTYNPNVRNQSAYLSVGYKF